MTKAEFVAMRAGRAEKARKRFEEEVARLGREDAIIDLLPYETLVTGVSINAYGADAHVDLEPVSGVEEVGRLMELFPPVPTVRYKDGSLSFLPLSFVEQSAKHADEKAQGIAPFCLIHRVWGFQPEEREFRWYSRLGPFLVELRLPIGDRRVSRITFSGGTYNRRGESMNNATRQVRCAEPSARHDSYWVTDTNKEAHVVFWWPEGVTWGHLVWNLEGQE